MDAPAPLPPDVLAALPPAVVALIQWQAEQIARLTTRVAELEAKLGLDSTNSSKPPSSAHPHVKPVRPKTKSQRRPRRPARPPQTRTPTAAAGTVSGRYPLPAD